MPSNVKDVPSTDSEVKLSSYGTSPPIPHTNRTYLGPHDITKKKDFLRQLPLCEHLCIWYDRCVCTKCTLTWYVCCACLWDLCVVMYVFMFMFLCLYYESIYVCMYVLCAWMHGYVCTYLYMHIRFKDDLGVSWLTNYYSYSNIGCFIILVSAEKKNIGWIVLWLKDAEGSDSYSPPVFKVQMKWFLGMRFKYFSMKTCKG